MNVQTDSGHSQWHGDSSENGEDSTEGDPQLAPDQLNLVAREVDVPEQHQQRHGEGQELDVKLKQFNWLNSKSEIQQL